MSRYTLINIEKIEAPEGSTFNNWYKFIIANSYNSITNIRCGTENEIREHAKLTINRLNAKYLTNCKVKAFNRSVNESGMSYSM